MRAIKWASLKKGPTELRKLAGSRDNRADMSEMLRPDHHLDKAATEIMQHDARIAFRRHEGDGQTLRLTAAFFPYQRLEQPFLGIEINIERALGDARDASNVVHARPVEAGRQEDRPSALHDLPTLGAAFRRFWTRRQRHGVG